MNNSFRSIDKSKVEKYWDTLYKYMNLESDINLEKARKILKKHEKETANPIQVINICKRNYNFF